MIIGLIIGLLIGSILMSILCSSKISELEENGYNAELRATTHFRKVFEVEHILTEAEKDKTPSVLVVDKIKKVITNNG